MREGWREEILAVGSTLDWSHWTWRWSVPKGSNSATAYWKLASTVMIAGSLDVVGVWVAFCFEVPGMLALALVGFSKVQLVGTRLETCTRSS